MPTTSLRSKSAALSKAPGAVSPPSNQSAGEWPPTAQKRPGAGGRGHRRRSRPSRCRRSRPGGVDPEAADDRSGSLRASRRPPSRLRRGRASSRVRRRRGRRRPAPWPRARQAPEDRLVFDEGPLQPPCPWRKTSSGRSPSGSSAAGSTTLTPRSWPTAWLWMVDVHDPRPVLVDRREHRRRRGRGRGRAQSRRAAPAPSAGAAGPARLGSVLGGDAERGRRLIGAQVNVALDERATGSTSPTPSVPPPSGSSRARSAISPAAPATRRRCATTSTPGSAGGCARGCWPTSPRSRPRPSCSAPELSMPILVAPVAYQRLVDPEGEVGDGAGRRGRRDRDVPLDPGHGAARRGRRGRAGGPALVPALLLPRRGGDEGADGRGRRRRASRRSSSPSTPRAAATASATGGPASRSPRSSASPASPRRSAPSAR